MNTIREINGIKPGKVKAKVWRELQGYDPLEGDKVDFEGCINKIAMVYGTDAAFIEDNLDIDDILPTFLECVHYVNGLVFSKLSVLPKNGEKAVE